MGISPATLIRKGERTAVKATLQVAPSLDFESAPCWDHMGLVESRGLS